MTLDNFTRALAVGAECAGSRRGAGYSRLMPFIQRDASGRIDSLHRDCSGGAMEFLADDHPQVRAFVGLAPGATERFERLDADFVRVIEDLIDVLIVKNVIAITDLPVEAQNKLYARKTFRQSAGRQSLRLFSDSASGADLVDTDFSNLA